MGADVAEACIAAAPYFSTLGTPASRTFLSGMHHRFCAEMPVTSRAEAAYFQLHLFSAAASPRAELTVEWGREALWGVTFDAPEGPVRLDRATRYSFLWPRVARAGSVGLFHVLETTTEALLAEP